MNHEGDKASVAIASGEQPASVQSREHNPAVSVIVPCYNGGHFIDALLSSLKAQTFADFEIIIVDDGSTDEATKTKLAALDTPIRVIRQQNSGPASARNTGIRHAQADLVLPIDCDDLLESTFLEETVSVMRSGEPELGFVFTDMQLSGLQTEVAPRHFKLFDQLFTNVVSCCLLVRKEAWRTAGGYDEAMRDGYEDWEFTIALARAGYRGVVIHKPLFIYRVSNDGLMMTRSSPRHAALWRFIREKHRELYTLSSLFENWWSAARSREISSYR